MDLDAITTPSELRRHVLAALKEREALGDHLARGARVVIETLERRANDLAWQLSDRTRPSAVLGAMEHYREQFECGRLSREDYTERCRQLMVRR